MKRCLSFSFIICVLPCLGALLLIGCGSTGPATVPTAYEPFVASDKSFSGTGPAGWEKKESDMGATTAQVEFTSGDADIYIVSDAATSFLGDAMKIGAKPPVEIIHERGLARMAEDMKEFSPLAMQTVNSPVGPARYSEFKAGEIHGYRATMMGPERAVTVICKCPEVEWPSLKPAFFKAFTDLKNGA